MALPSSRIIRAAVVFAAVALLLAVGAATPAQSDSAPLSLSLTVGHVGRISATVTGPAGARVQISEMGHPPIFGGTLPASGRLDVPQLSTWTCTPSRSFTVSEPAGPAGTTPTSTSSSTAPTSPSTVTSPSSATPPPSATASVMTPSCAHRLAWHLSSAPTTRSGIRLTVRDRWQLGHLALRRCVTAALGPASCVRLSLGAAPQTWTVMTPRPGRWHIDITGPAAMTLTGQRRVGNPHGAPLTLLAAGDSEMVDVGSYIDQVAAPHGARGSADAKSDSGLENEWFFNWYREARTDVARYHPQVTVIFMGANAGFAIAQGKHQVPCCDATWSGLYARAVMRLTRIFLQGNRGLVFWTTLPTPASSGFHQIFDAVNAAEVSVARAMPRRVGLIDANAFFTPGDVYRNTMTLSGSTFTIHQSDGLHLSTPADWAYAHLTVDDLIAAGLLR